MRNKNDDFVGEKLKTAQQAVEKRFESGEIYKEFPHLENMEKENKGAVQRMKDFQIISELKTVAVNLAKKNNAKDQDKFEQLRNKIFELQNIYDLTYLENV
jgi:hypothetical protein